MRVTALDMIPKSPQNWVKDARNDINVSLESLIPSIHTWPKALHQAQHHALLAPGKRFRPLLCLAISEGLGVRRDVALRIGNAAEFVHAASLILDDLPCMDDAELRRGRQTVHLAFSESTAILAATNLLNRAFGIVSGTHGLSATQRIDIVNSLSRNVGSNGLIAGQIADLTNSDMSIEAEKVETVNALKTGALFDFTVQAAAIMGKASAAQSVQLSEFSKQIGLAFQLLDDLKDEIMSEAQSQKSCKRDIGKATLLALEGSDAAMARLSDYMDQAQAAIIDSNLSTESTLIYIIKTQFSLPSL